MNKNVPLSVNITFLASLLPVYPRENPVDPSYGAAEPAVSADGLAAEAEDEVAQAVAPEGQAHVHEAHVGAAESSLFYPGRLVIIRKNTPTLDVYNGDVGIVIAQADDPERYDLYIGDREKRIPVGLLPEHDSAFALTIHQSQGSQFEHVAVLLPVNEGNPLATRELFYTGVTRAQKEAIIFGTKGSIEESVLQKTERASGLADRLTNN